MSVIYECDGCGHTTRDSRNISAVEINIKSGQGQGGKDYHLCPGCEKTLRRQADPTTWVRAEKSSAA